MLGVEEEGPPPAEGADAAPVEGGDGAGEEGKEEEKEEAHAQPAEAAMPEEGAPEEAAAAPAADGGEGGKRAREEEEEEEVAGEEGDASKRAKVEGGEDAPPAYPADDAAAPPAYSDAAQQQWAGGDAAAHAAAAAAAAYPGYDAAAYAQQAAGEVPEFKSIVIEVPNDKVGLVIGRGGCTIKELEMKSGCRVQITPDTIWQGKQMPRPIQLQGYQQQLEYCKGLVAEKVGVDVATLASEQVWQGGNAGGPGPHPAAPVVVAGAAAGGQGKTYITQGGPGETVIHVPNESVGLVIGKQGSTIKYLEQTTNARIQIAKECPQGSNMRPITLSGHQQSVDQAVALIKGKVNDGPAGGGGGGAAGYNQGYGGYQQGYGGYGQYPQQAWGGYNQQYYQQGYGQVATAAESSVSPESTPSPPAAPRTPFPPHFLSFSLFLSLLLPVPS